MKRIELAYGIGLRAARRVIVLILATVMGVATLLVAIPAAHADSSFGTPPVWAPGGTDEDTNAVGGIIFYDSSGNVVTSGSTSSAPLAAYAVGQVEPAFGDSKATLFFYRPSENVNPGTWSNKAQVGLSSSYPVASGPAVVTGTTLPVNTGHANDLKLDGMISTYPPNTDTGYANIYEVRLYTSSPANGQSIGYDYADIQVDPTAHTWTLIWTPASISTVTAPGAPTGVTATAGNQSATVSWVPPSDNGGAAITGYKIQYSSNSGSTWTDAGTATSSPHLVSGLTNGTAYVFRVAATNSVGTGNFSASSTSVTPEPSTPGAPTGVIATTGDGTVTLSWTAPNDGGSAIDHYTVLSSASPTSGFTAASNVTFTDPTHATVTGLANGTTYYFEITAHNAQGDGAASSPSVAATPATVPGVPTIGTATAGDAAATVQWTAPASNGGSAITGYHVQISTDGTTFADVVAPMGLSVSGTTATVTGLTNGTGYYFRVAATNAKGTGGYSAASAKVTPVADASSLTIAASKSVKYNANATVSGTLKDSHTGGVLSTQSVSLYRRASASKPYAFVKKVTTSSKGIVSTSVKMTSNVQWQWRYAGSSTHKAVNSAVASTTVVPIIAVKANHRSIKHGTKVELYGTVTPASTGAMVRVQELIKGKWKSLSATAKIKRQKLPSGKKAVGYVLVVKLAKKGTFKFRVYKPAVSTLAAGYSGTVKVKAT